MRPEPPFDDEPDFTRPSSPAWPPSAAPARRSAPAATRPSTAGERAQALAALPKLRVYSTQAAVTIEWAELRSPQARSLGFGEHTLNLDFRPADAGGGRTEGFGRRYDAERKLTVQLSPQEMLSFTATVMGWRDSLEVRFHGPQHDRGLIARANDDGGLFLSGQEPGRTLPVRLPREDRAALALLCTRVLVANHPGLDGSSVLQVLEPLLRSSPPT